MNSDIFKSEEDKKKAETLKKEFNDKVQQQFGKDFYVDIFKNVVEPPQKGPQKIYPYFCKTIPYSKELQKCIEGTVKELYNPNLPPKEAKKPGLLLGKIQSGKTRAFVGCMALAFDEGVDACIILTKGTNALVDQTLDRMKADFSVCKRDARPKRFPTVAIYDIMNKRMGLKSSLINNEKNIFVAKKQVDNMEALLDVFLYSEFKEKKILIIDDEADFVSRAFMRDKKDVKEGVIASQIDKLIEGLPNCRYLQVTATPYSLYLQPDNYVDVANGKVTPFRPRFTSIVPIHDQYIGSEQYFVQSQDPNSMYSCLYHAVDPDCVASLYVDKKAAGGKHIKHGMLLKNVAKSGKLHDLRWAVMHYFAASAIRELQEEALGNDPYHTSFVMHVGTDNDDQQWEAELIDTLLNTWSDQILFNDPELKLFNNLFDVVYDDLQKSIALAQADSSVTAKENIPNIPAKADVFHRVKELLIKDEYNVQLVNSTQNVRSLLDDKGQLDLAHRLNLFIGGFVLDRGITINHLLGFFYGREPQAKQQATVLQHCRMFGNRSLCDMSVTRLFSQKTLYKCLKKINAMDDMMRQKFVATVNDPKADPSIEFVIFDRANGIVPVSPSNILLSKSVVWKPNAYVLPSGQQTHNSAAKMAALVASIQQKIQGQPEKTCFDLDATVAIEIVKLAREQFVYSSTWKNMDHKWDENEMIELINRFKDKNGKIWGYTRNNCETGRERDDKKGFIDAPVDGQVESPYVKSQAVDRPVLLLQLNKGLKTKKWLGLPFYWPVLCLPNNMESIMYCPR